ncbi:MAG: hypothetical protein HZC41_06095 [Chloroflexi bacterium]|nr:hypothetical protein [Chloroflexota bacterium]
MSEYTHNGWLFAIEEDIGDIYRHWQPQSEYYAGGDALATALYLGWQASDIVLLERRWQGGSRRINIYHFELSRGDDTMAMPVLGNPYVERLIAEQGLRVAHLSKNKPTLPVKTIRPRVAAPASQTKEAWT